MGHIGIIYVHVYQWRILGCWPSRCTGKKQHIVIVICKYVLGSWTAIDLLRGWDSPQRNHFQTFTYRIFITAVMMPPFRLIGPAWHSWLKPSYVRRPMQSFQIHLPNTENPIVTARVFFPRTGTARELCADEGQRIALLCVSWCRDWWAELGQPIGQVGLCTDEGFQSS